MDTAWEAKYTHGNGGRTIGVNSEMDALPGIGHACGHNLIAIAGVAVAIALKTAIEHLGVPGKVVLLGTPGWFFVNSQVTIGREILTWAHSRGRRSREDYPFGQGGIQGYGCVSHVCDTGDLPYAPLTCLKVSSNAG